jgi:hypothetical protein
VTAASPHSAESAAGRAASRAGGSWFSRATSEGRAVDVVADIKMESKVESDELWFKNAIIYQLHVKAFADSNNDGIGP